MSLKTSRRILLKVPERRGRVELHFSWQHSMPVPAAFHPAFDETIMRLTPKSKSMLAWAHGSLAVLQFSNHVLAQKEVCESQTALSSTVSRALFAARTCELNSNPTLGDSGAQSHISRTHNSIDQKLQTLQVYAVPSVGEYHA